MDLFSSSFKITAARLSTNLLSLGSIVIFARELGANQLGVFFLFQALYSTLYFITDLGISEAIVKRVSERTEQGHVLSSGLLTMAIPVLIVILVVLFFRGFINEYLGMQLAIFLAIGVVLNAYSKISIKLVQAELQIGWYAALQFLQSSIFVGVGILLLKIGFGVEGLIYGLLSSDAILIVAGGLLRSTPLRKPSRKQVGSLIEFSKYAFPTKLSARAMSWADVLIIGVFLSQAHVGAYEVAWRISKPAVLLAMAVSNVLFPQISGYESGQSTKNIRSATADGLALALLLPIPAFFGVLIYSQDILLHLFGEGFKTAWIVLIVLMLGRIVYAVFLIFSGVLKGMGEIQVLAKASIIVTVFNLTLNTILISYFGIIGAAVATTLTFALFAGILAYELSQLISISIDYKLTSMVVVASIGMTVLSLSINTFYSINDDHSLILSVSFGAVVYIVILSCSSHVRGKLTDIRSN